jgi:hypothetical protein
VIVVSALIISFKSRTELYSISNTILGKVVEKWNFFFLTISGMYFAAGSSETAAYEFKNNCYGIRLD